MKKRVELIVMCCAVLLGSFCITGIILGAGETPAEAAVEGYAVNAYASGNKPLYILRTFNGNIAVFYGEFQNEPAIETGIRVDGLRSVDKALLDKGIEVEKYDDVLKLLEDFGS